MRRALLLISVLAPVLAGAGAAVHDEIWNAYVTPQPGYPTLPASPLAMGVDVATENWAPVPGVTPTRLMPGWNGIPIQAKGVNAPGVTAIVWKADTFAPDQWAEIAHNPPAAKTADPDAGVSVRQDPNSNSCYSLHLWYQGLEHLLGTVDSAFVWIDVYRWNSGVKTLLVRKKLPPWVHAQDWWYMQLQVWGQNPVHLRAITKAPEQYQPGQVGLADGWVGGTLPNMPTYIIPAYSASPIMTDQGSDDLYWGGIYEWWATYGTSPPNDLAVAEGDPNWTKSNPGRVWIVWEGEDASPQRLLAGQPGIRTVAASFGANKFSAADLPQTLSIFAGVASGHTVPVSGWKPANATVSLASTSGTPGAVSYPDGQPGERWSASISDLYGAATVTATASDATSASTQAIPADTTAPTITAFGLPSSATTLTVPLTFAATDELSSVTGYCAKEDGATPAANDACFRATAPTSFTFAFAGPHTLYGWAKDVNGNISTRSSAACSVAYVVGLPIRLGIQDWTGATGVWAGVDRVSALIVTVPVDMDVSSLVFAQETWLNDSTAHVRGAIYDNATGALLGVSTEKLGVAVGWNTVTFPQPVHLAAGQVIAFGTHQDTLIMPRSILNYGSPAGWDAIDAYADGTDNPVPTPLTDRTDGRVMYLSGVVATQATCTSWTYSAWGSCQPNSTQTRTVLTSSPSGCTGGAPVTTQSCTYVPPTCTSWTYSAWGACQPNNTQTRTVLTSSPSGCAGGSPVTTQACTYTAPTCSSYTWSAWGSCQPNGQQTRTVTGSPAGCTFGFGAPASVQSCTYTAGITLKQSIDGSVVQVKRTSDSATMPVKKTN